MLSGERAWAGRHSAQILYAVTVEQEKLRVPAGCPAPLQVSACGGTPAACRACRALLPWAFAIAVDTERASSAQYSEPPPPAPACPLLQELVDSCLQDDHKQRPSFAAIEDRLAALLETYAA